MRSLPWLTSTVSVMRVPSLNAVAPPGVRNTHAATNMIWAWHATIKVIILETDICIFKMCKCSLYINEKFNSLLT